MKAIYNNSTIPEREAKIRYHFPENIMMENAAAALEKLVLDLTEQMGLDSDSKVLIVCGSGNNGGDGYALARRLYGRVKVSVIAIAEPRTFESIQQCKMAKAVGVDVTSTSDSSLIRLSDMIVSGANIIVDCIYGTGFHGQMPEASEKLIKLLNASSALRIACDISSGIDEDGNCSPVTFKADYTVTMGALKSALFTDAAKDYTGTVSVADLGIAGSVFDKCGTADAYLIEASDVKLPLRKKRSTHKGCYGHTVVIAGEKSGAAIMGATAAMEFGSGLTTLYKAHNSNLEQFKISPELMIAQKIPAKTTCVVIGSGLGNLPMTLRNEFTAWFASAKNPSCVLDADMFGYENLGSLLTQLNGIEGARIVLTPHKKELERLLENLSVETPEELVAQFKNVVIAAKSANTKIYAGNKVYVMVEGVQSLSKGGSGDVLAGMIGALLSQGYSALDAVITGTMCHALAAKKLGREDFSLTPLKLIEAIN